MGVFEQARPITRDNCLARIREAAEGRVNQQGEETASRGRKGRATVVLEGAAH